jgi:hypothetical protein
MEQVAEFHGRNKVAGELVIFRAGGKKKKLAAEEFFYVHYGRPVP